MLRILISILKCLFNIATPRVAGYEIYDTCGHVGRVSALLVPDMCSPVGTNQSAIVGKIIFSLGLTNKANNLVSYCYVILVTITSTDHNN